MEKIHGTSTWISYDKNNIHYHSGGESGPNFQALFDNKFMVEKLTELMDKNNWTFIKIHGEFYGDRQQGMRKTYGDKLKFIAFDIRVEYLNDLNSDGGNIESKFLDILCAEKIVIDLNLEFVDYVRGPNTPEWIEEQSNRESVQAIRNGIGCEKPREGVVIRPLKE